MTFKELRKATISEGKEAAKRAEEQLHERYPDGQITEDQAREVLSPILRKLHKIVNEMTAETINQMNEAAGIGLKAINPEYDIERENELVAEISRRSFEDGFTW